MIVAASILLAAVVGGVVFVLLDNWQRREPAPAAPQPQPQIWTPEQRTEPLPPRPRPEPLRPTWDADDRPDDYPPNLWSGWARRERK
jgi:hypothetical protein